MFQFLQIASLLLVAIAMSFALAHAAELPGKMRLDRQTYITIQRIYHPGFTVGGTSEPLAIAALAVLLFATPTESSAFVWTALALVSLSAMQAVYWLVTHPINGVWLKGEKLPDASTAFFAIGSRKDMTGHQHDSDDWTRSRNRWEYSHVWRASFAVIGLVVLAIAVTSGVAAA